MMHQQATFIALEKWIEESNQKKNNNHTQNQEDRVVLNFVTFQVNQTKSTQKNYMSSSALTNVFISSLLTYLSKCSYQCSSKQI